MSNDRHGQSRTRLYTTWRGMKSRCKGTSNHLAKRYYTDRGIEVCPEWESSFVDFQNWANASGYSDSLEIDRIDNTKGYFPENCRWVTHGQQMANTGKRCDGYTSRFKGVSWHPGTKKWRAQINRNGRNQHVGLYKTEEDAAKGYDDVARADRGEYAALNFPERYAQGGASF